MVLSIECVLNSDTIFPGQVLIVKILFRNDYQMSFIKSNNVLTPLKEKNSQSSSSINLPNSSEIPAEKIEWIAVTMNGITKIDPHWLALSNFFKNSQTSSNLPQKSPILKGSNDSSFTPPPLSENSYCIFSSEPSILGSDISIPFGSDATFLCQLNIPFNLPPSFKGGAIKYSYFISITVKLKNSSTKTIQCPFRILNPICAIRQIQSLPVIQPLTLISKSLNKIEGLEPLSALPQLLVLNLNDNNFQESEEKLYYENFKKVIQIHSDLSKIVSANISRDQQPFVKVTLNRSSFELGSVILGQFDFLECENIHCFQISVTLLAEEIIEPSFQNPSRSKPFTKTYGEYHELTINTLHTSFMFQIPVDAPQEFSTDVVSVKWSLQFLFLTYEGKLSAIKPNVSPLVEPLKWIFPLRVLVPSLPPNPISKTKNRLNLT